MMLTGGLMRPDQAAGTGVQTEAVIRKFYRPGSKAFTVLLQHGEQVAERSLYIARRLGEGLVDMAFIEEAAMLHDIGILRVKSPEIGCHGEFPYVCHGVFGREMLDALGLVRHGLVCERHVGAGLTAEEIRLRKLPLPERDMLPVSLEEKIIAYADKFYSKKPGRQDRELPFDEVVKSLERYGRRQVETFLSWAEMFGEG